MFSVWSNTFASDKPTPNPEQSNDNRFDLNSSFNCVTIVKGIEAELVFPKC